MVTRINQGTNSSTTQDWLEAAKSMKLTAYEPVLQTYTVSDVLDPDEAVSLSSAERARMNKAKQGVRTPPERV